MPEISRFYGVRITMNYDEHLPPHFHAAYGSEEAQILIATGKSCMARCLDVRQRWFESGH